MIPFRFRNGIAGIALAAALSLSSGAVLATPGKGGMGGGCGSCGGGSDSSISRQDASQQAGDAARDAVNQGGGGITTGGGGRPSEDMSGAIAQLGASQPASPGTPAPGTAGLQSQNQPAGVTRLPWGVTQRLPDGTLIEGMPDGATRTTRPDGTWFRTPPPEPPPGTSDGGVVGPAVGGGNAN